MFRASKYRNVLGSNVPREEWYEELQLDDGRLDLYPLASNENQMAFVSQQNSGASIEIKALKDVGKANVMQKAPCIVRGHSQRINALEFYYFDTQLKSTLVSGGDDGVVKVWKLGDTPGSYENVWSHEGEPNARVLKLKFHPSASDLLGIATTTAISVVDIQQQAVVCDSFTHPDLITGFAWKDDGSSIVSVCQDNQIRNWDPRQQNAAISFSGHQGRKAASITWCNQDFFLTAGFNAHQEREMALWDLKRPDSPIARERLDSGTGILSLVFDEDTNLLFISGRGDKIIRTYEIQFKRPFFTLLQQTTVFKPTWGLYSLPKRSCALESCEVARLLSVSQASIEPLSFTVPRREASNQFQSDLYPDSRSNIAVLTSAEYVAGSNATPNLAKVQVHVENTPVASTAPSSFGWNQGDGWGSVPTTTLATPVIEDAPSTIELSEKAKKLGSIQGNKFKYISGKPFPRSESYLNVPTDGNVLVANETYWATSIVGTGGPVLVQKLDNVGKIDGATVLNGQKMAVTDMEFNPFHVNILATGSDDSTIQIWDVNSNQPLSTLTGHGRGIRCLSYHPTAENVIASGSMDSTIRFWDISRNESISEINKFDEPPFNISFNFDGNLFATITRDRILRVIDPRLTKTIAMACAHEGTKTQRVTWCNKNNSSHLITVGFNTRSERQISLWDARNLLDPLQTISIDTSGSILLPYYDESLDLIYLVSRGDSSILSYEINEDKLIQNSTFSYTGETISCGALLPKKCCNISDVEISRFLISTKSTIEKISFYLPRAEKLKEFFQDDIYGDIRNLIPLYSSNEWYQGKNKMPTTISLCPKDMKFLSKNEINSISISKVIDFKTKKRNEEKEMKLREENFKRLESLAFQPSLHGTRQYEREEEDDDDWND